MSRHKRTKRMIQTVVVSTLVILALLMGGSAPLGDPWIPTPPTPTPTK